MVYFRSVHNRQVKVSKMNFILTIGLFVIAISAQVFAKDDHESHACAQPKFELAEGQIGCMAAIPAWYHDHSDGLCKEYLYDGCNKSANHFESKEKCDETCAKWHEEHKDHHHGSTHKHSDDCKHEQEHEHEHHEHEHHHHH